MKKRWSELSERRRRAILILASVDAVLKTVALADLKRRDADEVRGSKKLWATAIVLINSGGLVPVAYFVRGRKGS
ncbi:MAG TPA: hypothetical protein PLZ93_15865 [Nocardioides sp.]|uniref:hypothetical protein n=1 Tax=uncultured Nocardioides sp. TaxID=198441 RepID=UPI000EBB3CE5|nr:hypothetical protein [uncultured Nocardioides sp.]HCB06384.1 hypothetical protein [Nocardioides sp.]HRD59865.1 hypothetical protein [Nocardioides sp.]HRI97092.1 hypothetical protein [Nocardioides sp.]HRK47468.1 hypothetical protein [Nocardioides sp.]